MKKMVSSLEMKRLKRRIDRLEARMTAQPAQVEVSFSPGTVDVASVIQAVNRTIQRATDDTPPDSQ